MYHETMFQRVWGLLDNPNVSRVNVEFLMYSECMFERVKIVKIFTSVSIFRCFIRQNAFNIRNRISKDGSSKRLLVSKASIKPVFVTKKLKCKA